MKKRSQLECEKNEQLRTQLAKANEYTSELEVKNDSLKESLNGCTEKVLSLSGKLAKANERVGKLEKERSNLSAKYKKNVSVIGAFVSELTGKVIILPKMRTKEEIEKSLNKFAIEQQIEGIESSIAYAEGKSHFVDVSDLQDYIEQLRKEQNND